MNELLKLLTKLCCCFILVGLVACGKAPSQEVELFRKGNRMIEDAEYEKAIELYRQVLENGWYSFELYHNSGNAYFKNKQWGEAVLFYERALKLKPTSKQASKNLRMVQLNLKEPVLFLPDFIIWRELSLFSSNAMDYQWALLGFFMLSMAIVIKYLKLSRKAALGVLFVGICLLSLALIRHAELYHHESGIIMVREGILRESPDEMSREVRSISVGNKVIIEDHLAEWFLVRLGDGDQGWIEMGSIEKI